MAPRYELIRTIATGGMAQVFEAIMEGGEGESRRVALKRILPERAGDEAMRRMFLDEARTVSRLSHVKVVGLLDYGEIDGTGFLVSEFIDGLDVSRAIERGGAMPESLALRIGADVAHALAYLEEQGVVHRDISPQNVLLSWTGDVKLADFGIAVAPDRGWHTTTGVVKGKRAYMAPEQARGESVSGPADVYALAVSINAMLTGTEPEPPGVGRAALVDASIEAEIAEALSSALDYEPEARPTAADFAGQLEALLESRGAVVGATEIAQWMQPLREARPKPSALDDLLGLHIVVSEAGDERRYTVHRHTEDGHDAGLGYAKTVPHAVSSSGADLTAPSSRGRSGSPVRWVLAAITAAGLLGVAWFVWQGSMASGPGDEVTEAETREIVLGSEAEAEAESESETESESESESETESEAEPETESETESEIARTVVRHPEPAPVPIKADGPVRPPSSPTAPTRTRVMDHGLDPANPY